MRKVGLIAVLVALAGMAWYFIAGASTATNSSASMSTPQGNGDDQQDLIVVTPWELTAMDPSKSGFIFQRLQIAETLVDAKQNAELQPMLAQSWSSNDKGDVWTFVLRDDVVFHDGSPLTADDVVKSLQVALTKPTALESAAISNIKAIDSKTVEITLDKPLMSFPAYLAHATSIILASASFDENNEVTKLLGTGPYYAKSLC